MFNQDILKKITILYVEDEAQIRESMHNIFQKLFKEVYIAEDGQLGLDLFKKLRDDNISIDVIVSDINMPHMNGLEMIKEIRDIDTDIPFVLTTAHAETMYFMEAIKLGVTHYAIKPLVIKDLIKQIQDVGFRKYQEMIIKKQEKENEQYIDIIDKVAVVSRTDLKGNITFANEIFCEVSGYSIDELIGQNQNIVRHPDVAKSVFEELWATIQDGKVWQGKVKNKSKDGEVYIVNATIFPLFDETGDNIIEYMSVRFIITEEENEKREFKRKVITSIKQQKQKEQGLNYKVKELETQLKVSGHDNLVLIQDALELEKQKSMKAKGQVLHYEDELKKEKLKSTKIQQDANNKIADLISSNKLTKDTSHKYREKALNLQLDVTSKVNEITRVNGMLDEQAKMIKDLKDVIEHREKQLGKN